MSEDETVAYHEAGHAVIARVLGVGLVRVIMFSTETRGETRTRTAAYWVRNAEPALLSQAIERDLVIHLAGMHVDLRRDPEAESKWGKSWGVDLDNVQHSLEWLGEMTKSVGDSEQLLAQLHGETKALVEQNWAAITRVAQALRQRRYLTEANVDALMAGPTDLQALAKPHVQMNGVVLDLSERIEWTDHDDLDENLAGDFDVVCGDDGCWYLWWRAERVWVARFPDRATAKHILVGDWDGSAGNPGWPRSAYTNIDLPGALSAYARFPQIELEAGSSTVELFTRINTALGCTFIGELMKIESDVVELDPGLFYPMVKAHLAAGDYGLDARASAMLTPWFTRLLLRVYVPEWRDDGIYGATIPTPLVEPVGQWLRRIGREELIHIREEETYAGETGKEDAVPFG